MAMFAELIQLQPVMGLGVFLLLSAHHWGQSHGDSGSPRLTFLGACLIAELVLLHTGESRAFLELLAPHHVDQLLEGIQVFGLVGFAGFALLAASETFSTKGENWIGSSVFKEVLLLASVASLSALNGLVWSFSVYFSLGHAVDAWRDQFSNHQQVASKFGEYYLQGLPYSIAFMLGLAMLALLALNGLVPPSLALSVLLAGTVPHVVLLDWWVPHTRREPEMSRRPLVNGEPFYAV